MVLSTASAVPMTLGRSEEPHSVDQAHQALLFAAEHDVVMGIGVEEEIGRVNHEVGIDRLPVW